MCGDILFDYLAPDLLQEHQRRPKRIPSQMGERQDIGHRDQLFRQHERGVGCLRGRIFEGTEDSLRLLGGKLTKRAREKNVPFILVPLVFSRGRPWAIFLDRSPLYWRRPAPAIRSVAIDDVSIRAVSAKEAGPKRSHFSTNAAKKIALALNGHVPIVYCPRSVRSIGVRWQNQINENAKVVAFTGEIPEMNHNQMVGWLNGNGENRLKPVFIVPSALEPTVKKMTMVTLQMFNEKGPGPGRRAAGREDPDGEPHLRAHLGRIWSAIILPGSRVWTPPRSMSSASSRNASGHEPLAGHFSRGDPANQ